MTVVLTFYKSGASQQDSLRVNKYQIEIVGGPTWVPANVASALYYEKDHSKMIVDPRFELQWNINLRGNVTHSLDIGCGMQRKSSISEELPNDPHLIQGVPTPYPTYESYHTWMPYLLFGYSRQLPMGPNFLKFNSGLRFNVPLGFRTKGFDDNRELLYARKGHGLADGVITRLHLDWYLGVDWVFRIERDTKELSEYALFKNDQYIGISLNGFYEIWPQYSHYGLRFGVVYEWGSR